MPIQDGPRICIAPCLNGAISPGMDATISECSVLLKCNDIIEKGGRAFAVLENQDTEMTMTVPTATVTVVVVQPQSMPGIPSTDAGVVNWAFAILKAHLVAVKKQNVAKYYHTFEILQWIPAFEMAFGFVANKTSTEYSVVNGKISQWDKTLGKRWDVLAKDSYCVTKMVFYKKKMSPAVNLLSAFKVTCQLFLVQLMVQPGEDYRADLLQRLTQKQHSQLFQ